MKKRVLIVSMFILTFMALPPAASAMEYQHTLEVRDMVFSWSLDGDNIHIELSAKTTGWVGIGFSPEKAMQGANIIIGAVKGERFKVEDHYGDRKRNHNSDKKLGGTDNVSNAKGSEKDGFTTISFTYPLKTDDKWDKPITTDGAIKLMLAYGRDGKDKLMTKATHKYRTIYEVNLSTGENKKIK